MSSVPGIGNTMSTVTLGTHKPSQPCVSTVSVRRVHVSLRAALLKSRGFSVWKTVMDNLPVPHGLGCWLGAMNVIPMETRTAKH